MVNAQTLDTYEFQPALGATYRYGGTYNSVPGTLEYTFSSASYMGSGGRLAVMSFDAAGTSNDWTRRLYGWDTAIDYMEVSEDGYNYTVYYDSPWAMIPRYVSPGQHYSTQEQYHYSVNGVYVSGNVEADIHIIGVENVTLPIGTLEAIKGTVEAITTETFNGGWVQATQTMTLWYARGVGMIKQTINSSYSASNGQSDTLYTNISLNYSSVALPKLPVYPASTTISPATWSVGAAAGSYQISVTSNTNWSVSGLASWLSAVPASGSGNGTVTISYAANSTTSQRQDSFTIGGESHALIQAGEEPQTSIRPTYYEIGPDGGSYSINVTSNTSWSVSGLAPWVDASPMSGTGNGLVQITVEPNTRPSVRQNSFQIGGRLHLLSQQAGAPRKAALGSFRVPDFDGNGADDLFWARLADRSSFGQRVDTLLDGGAVQNLAWTYIGGNATWRLMGFADWNGDGKSDLLWRNTAAGDYYAQIVDGWNDDWTAYNLAWVYIGGDANWEISGTPDWNGDGKSDLLWRKLSTGEYFAQIVTGFNDGWTAYNVAWVYIGGSHDFVMTKTPDWNGDRKSDVLWRQASTGYQWAQILDGFNDGWTAYNVAWVWIGGDLDYSITLTPDWDGDGKSDLLWRQASTGYQWAQRVRDFTDGGAVFNYAWNWIGGDLDYSCPEAPDFDGDGKADLFWHQASTGYNWAQLVSLPPTNAPAQDIAWVWIGGDATWSMY